MLDAQQLYSMSCWSFIWAQRPTKQDPLQLNVYRKWLASALTKDMKLCSSSWVSSGEVTAVCVHGLGADVQLH